MSTLEPDYGYGTQPPGTELFQSSPEYAPAFPTEADPSSPVSVNLPRAQRSFVNKYNDIGSDLEQVPPEIRNALIDFDLQRVQRGQPPISRRQTSLAVLSAIQNKAITPEPKKSAVNVWGNAISNIQDLVTSIPKLPFAAVQEIKELPQFASKVRENQEAGMNPISAIARAPGVRLIPGAYTVGNIAEGPEGITTALENPVFTALDVIPGAQKAAASTALGKAAKAQGINPLRAMATKTLDESGALIPGKLGRITDPLSHTKPGLLLRETFGKESKQVSQLEAQASAQARGILQGTEKTVDPDLVRAQQAAEFVYGRAEKEFGVTSQRAIELKPIAEMFRSTDDAVQQLPPNELAYLESYREQTRQLGNTATAMDLMDELGGEFYDPSTASKIRTRSKQAASATGKIQVDVIPRLEQVATNDARIQPLIDHLRAGEYAEALKVYNGLMRGKTLLGATRNVGPLPGPRGNQSLAAIANIRTDIRRAVAADKVHKRVLDESVPARFQPLVEREAMSRLQRHYVANAASDTQEAAIMQAFADRNYTAIDGWDEGLRKDFMEDAGRMWGELKASGHDPIFVHRAPTNAEIALQYPQIRETLNTVSQVKKRTMDMTPHAQDMNIALGHQAMELINRKVSEQFVDTLKDTMAHTTNELTQRYMPAAQARAKVDPSKDVTGHLQELMNREWGQWTPGEMTPWKAGKVTAGSGENLWLPKAVQNNLKRMAPGPGKLTSPLDPIMTAFRTALLPLSPRWHIYNIIGGAAMLQARTGPGVWRYLGDARAILKDVKAGGTGEIGRLADTGGLPDALRRSLGTIGRDTIEFNYYGTKTLKRLADQAAANHPRGHAYIQSLEKVTDAGQKVIEKSFNMNAFFDDTYRVMAYLEGFDKSLTRGLTPEAAQVAGLTKARKIMQSWDSMTPIERQVIRHVFPFYGFMSHIFKYAMTYPFDHPIRASLMGSFARNEIEDLGTGIPQSFLSAFVLGEPDERGNVTTVNFGGMNPFRDVASMMTLAGLAGNTNPIVGTILEQLGVNTAQGGPELYPNLQYDPRTGRLKADAGNPAMNLIQNTIPQTRVLAGLAGASDEYKSLYERDPKAAGRYLRSQLGLPVVVKDINLPQEHFKAEIARDEGLRDALKKALKGDTSDLRKYPSLEGVVETVNQLKRQGQLGAYQANPGTAPNILTSLREAVFSL
jgi:hypothetical protein